MRVFCCVSSNFTYLLYPEREILKLNLPKFKDCNLSWCHLPACTKIMSEVKNLVFMSLIFGLAGCITQYAWVKSSDPLADDSVDLYECANLAVSSGAAYTQSDYQAPPAINAGPFSNEGCYNPNVSNVNCLSSTPQSMIPQTFNSQFGEDAYQRFVDKCMNERGWRKSRVK